MSKFYCFLFLCLYLFNGVAFSQELEKGLWVGTIYENGNLFSYQLQINSIIGTEIKGYSISKNSNFNCIANFEGKINGKNILIIETNVLKTNFPKKEEICLMSIQLKQSSKQLIGEFTSKNKANKNCGKGIVNLVYKQLNQKINLPNSVNVDSDSNNAFKNVELKIDFNTTKISYKDSIQSTKVVYENANENTRKIEMTDVVVVPGERVEIEVYDNGVVDGDEVTLIINGDKVLQHKKISEKPLKFELIKSQTSSFLIEFYAENLGTIPPNTGLIIIKNNMFRKELNFSSDFLKTNAIKIVFN